MKHTPFTGWAADARTQAAIDAGRPEWAELPAVRKDAKAAGSTHYFTGKACRNGHVVQRWVGDRRCCACESAYQKTPKARAYKREYSRTPERRAHNREYDKTPERRTHNLALNAQRRATKLDATPPWLTDEHRAIIRAIYAEAARLTKATGIPHHVDYIVPLNHPDVCGLHIPANLQVLTAPENCSKNNAFDGTMDNEGWRSRI